MKLAYNLLLFSITILRAEAQETLVQVPILEAIDLYIESEDYKHKGYGFLIVELDSCSLETKAVDGGMFKRPSLNSHLVGFDAVIFPAYDSFFFNVNPPASLFFHKGHLVALYTGSERLVSRRIEKSFFANNKELFADLNDASFTSFLKYVKFRYRNQSFLKTEFYEEKGYQHKSQHLIY